MGKHSSDAMVDIGIENPKKKFKIIIIVVIVLLAIAGGLAGVYFGMNLFKNGGNKKVPAAVTNTVTPTQAPTATEDPNAMPSKVGNYNVLGKIVIEKIKLEQYILDKTDEEALKQGLTKLYGNALNKTGNFCIAGHNKEKMFLDLNKINKNDTFYIIDKNQTKVTYKVVDKYSVEPDDLEPLLNNEKEKEVTLITCESGAKKRLVVKAKEVTDTSKKTN